METTFRERKSNLVKVDKFADAEKYFRNLEFSRLKNVI